MSADKDYIERIARERLGYAYPDEKVYIDSSKNWAWKGSILWFIF